MGSDQSKPSTQSLSYESTPIANLNQYNWIPSFQTLRHPVASEELVPNSDNTGYLDLRRHMPEIPEPDQKGYQVVKAFCFALNYELVASRKISVFPPSYEYLKYFLDNSVGANQLHSFQHLSEVIKSFGICGDSECRTDQQVGNGPSDTLIESARKYRHLQLKIMEPDMSQGDMLPASYTKRIIEKLLAGKVVLIGMPWYSNFLKSQDMPALSLPTINDFIQGGFCGVIVGFIDKDQQWIVATCQGRDWGDHGYIYLPYNVLIQTGGELVTIELNEELIQLDIDTKRYPASNLTSQRRMAHGWRGTEPVHRPEPTADTCSISRTLY
jgi:hypothetical protein